MKRDRRVGEIVWAAALAAGGAAVGRAALRTADGRELDENLFKAANAGHGETVDRSFSGVTELGSLYAAARVPAPWGARSPPGSSCRGRSGSSTARVRSLRTRRGRDG